MTDTNRRQIIPLDDAINSFDKHLQSHPRTILSARFGDGKSFFLASAEKKLKRKYVFLKIYPVNYQVTENKDIFEYIKRDLLFQLYGQELIPESYEISDDIAAFFFLKNNWESFAEEILNELSNFDASNAIKTALGAAKFLSAMKKKYDSFRENGGEIGERLDRFIETFDNKGIYEADPITAILSDIIARWKAENKKKKVILVFEDMDRIDPAHIFRILNVISAQMDYCYKFGVSPKASSLQGNKFGVDNIVVCLDYDNLKGIFHHFYGKDASFDGYINKFSDKGYFSFSLKEQTRQFYANELMRITGMSSEVIVSLMDKFDFTSYTLRQFYHACDGIEKQISLPIRKGPVVAHRGFYTIAALLFRLSSSREDVIQVLSGVIKETPWVSLKYFATTMLLRRNASSSSGFAFSFGMREEGAISVYYVSDIHFDGSADIGRQQYLAWDRNSTIKPEEELDYMLQYVDR